MGSILSAIMQSANQMATAGMRGGGNEKEDPQQKEERAAIRRMLESFSKERSPDKIEAWREHAEQYGVSVDPYLKTSQILTPEEKQAQEGQAFFTKLFEAILGGQGNQSQVDNAPQAPPPLLASPTGLNAPPPYGTPMPERPQVEPSPSQMPPTMPGRTKGAPSAQKDLTERVSLTVDAKGNRSITLGPRKAKTAKELAEAELLSGPEHAQIIEWEKDKLLGGKTTIQWLDNPQRGTKTMMAVDERGRIKAEQEFKIDYTADQKRAQALEDKLTIATPGTSEMTGKPTVTVFSPRGGVHTIEGKTQVAQTAAEKAAQAEKQKLTENVVKVDKNGNLILVPVKGGKIEGAQIGPNLGVEPKTLSDEARQRMTNNRTIVDMTQGVRSHIDKELKKAGYTLSDLTGPITGRLKEINARLFDDPEFEKFRAKVRQLVSVVYGLTGKQLNQWEFSWLSDDILPQLKQPTGNFLARLEAFEEWIHTQRVNDAASAVEVGIPVPASGDLRADVEKVFKERGSLTVNPPSPSGRKPITSQEQQELNELRKSLGLLPE